MAAALVSDGRFLNTLQPRSKPCGGEAPHLLKALALALAALLALPALAAAACLPIAQNARGLLQPARYAPLLAAAAPGTVSLTFLGHASFLIETPAGAAAVTDYNGVIRPSFVPDIVTMNNAHPMHYTDTPDPGIKYVLRGWDEPGRLARYDILYKDMRVRNVPTNVRDETDGTRFNGNSIFVFEAANLCIAHLGHLHHTLTDVHLGELGQIDVLLVPVDGAYTMSQFDMIEVVHEIAAPLVIPMHFFTAATLERFLARMRETHEIAFSDSATVVLARDTLPRGKPKVLVLPGH
ncbi:MAG: MBL fold metallo-hydrolase [Alphaproteobacteria bacterium]